MIIKADKRIKELRNSRGMTQTELAKVMTVTRSSVNAWEMGISIPTAAKLVELSLFFHVTTDYILGLEKREILSLDELSGEQKEILYDLMAYFQRINNPEKEEREKSDRTV